MFEIKVFIVEHNYVMSNKILPNSKIRRTVKIMLENRYLKKLSQMENKNRRKKIILNFIKRERTKHKYQKQEQNQYKGYKKKKQLFESKSYKKNYVFLFLPFIFELQYRKKNFILKMGCGTLHSTPNSTITISQKLIYVGKSISNNSKHLQKTIQQKVLPSLQKGSFQKKNNSSNSKPELTIKNSKSKQISLNELKLKGKQKKVRFRESWHVQNLDNLQIKQNLFSKNIFQNQDLVCQQRKIKKTFHKLNKPQKLSNELNSSSICIHKSMGTSLNVYQNRIVLTEAGTHINLNSKQNLHQNEFLPIINRQSLKINNQRSKMEEPSCVLKESKQKRENIIIQKIPFLEDYLKDDKNEKINLILSSKNQDKLSFYNVNESLHKKCLRKDRRSFDPVKNNNETSSSLIFPGVKSIQRFNQKNKTGVLKNISQI